MSSESSWTLGEIAAAIQGARNSGDAKRFADQILAGAKPSAEVIEQWRAYLPPDCISTMIQMGWDKTG